MAILPRTDLVESFSQAVNIRLRVAGAFRRNKTFRADVRPGLAAFSHQTDVCELRNHVHKNDVRRFYVAVNQAVLVKFIQRETEAESKLNAFLQREPAAT